ncbi:MAG TPA: 50S ribosomal protein L25 [Candidatus Paceibacterota bacterium]
MFSITAKTRDLSADLEKMRSNDEMPSVYYGSGVASTSISVPKIAFQKIWRDAGESTPIELVVDGKKVNVLIHDVSMHPVTNEPIHVDFLVVDMSKKISVFVPLEFVGVAPAVKSGLGILVKVLHEIEIEALPKDLPHNIEVDISTLVDAESQIAVSDLKMPTGVTAIAKASEVVAAIALQKEEKEEESAPVDLSAIEVEKKGKKEEEAPASE